MHPLTHRLKRAFHRSHALGKEVLAEIDLTPSRLDLLRTVHADGTPQRLLQYLLHVASATISRMLTSLERLGFVSRQRFPNDRRRLYVELTEKARVALGWVDSKIADGSIPTLVQNYLGHGTVLPSAIARTSMMKLEDSLLVALRGFRDHAVCPYPSLSQLWRLELRSTGHPPRT